MAPRSMLCVIWLTSQTIEMGAWSIAIGTEEKTYVLIVVIAY